MKNRIVAVFLIVFQIFSFTAFAKDDFPVPEWLLDDVVTTTAGMGEEYTDSYSILSFLGAVDESADRIDPESIAERGYAADIFAKLYNGSALPAPKKELYLDVPLDYQWASGIYAAVEYGLISNSDSRFYPGKAVTVNEVAQMGLVLLGYSKIKNINVTEQMNNLKFLKGITLNGDTLTKGQLFTMIKNILFADVLEYTPTQNGGFEITKTGKSYLSECENIYLIKGVVTSIGESAVYGKSNDFDERVEINKIKYDSKSEIEENVLGKSVYAYVYDPDDEAIIIDTWETKDNQTYEIPTHMLDELTDSHISYYENDKTKKLKLNSETAVVYNGQYYGNIEKAVRKKLSSGCDYIKAIDNDNDGICNIVFIDKSDYYIADKVTPSEEKISFKYSNYVLNLKNEENVILKNSGGEIIEISSVSSGYVVEIKEATRVNGDKCYNITVSNNKITDKLSATYTKDGITYYKVGDEVYTLSSYYENYLLNFAGNKKPTLGQTVTFYIGSNNKIVYSDSNPYTFGYLIKKTEDEDTEALGVKLYSESGKFENLKLKDRVTVITYDNQSGAKMSASEALNVFSDAQGKLVNQLICYKENANGEITTLVKEYDLTGQKPYDTGYPLVKNHTLGGEGIDTNGNRMYYRVFGYYDPKNGLWILPSSVKNMKVARDSKNYDNEAYFGVGTLPGSTLEKYFADEELVFYNTDDFRNVGFCLVMGGSSAVVDSRVFMVSSVMGGLNKEEIPGTIVEYYNTDNQKETMFVGEAEVLSSSTNYPGVTDADDANGLSVGDLFRYKKNIDGEGEYIQIISKAGRAMSNWTYSENNNGSTGYNGFTFNENAIWSAQVVDTTTDYGGRICVNIDPYGNYDPEYDFVLQMNTYTNLYGKNIINLYDTAKNKVEVASFGDILPGDRVILVYRYTSVTNIFIIR